MALSSKLGSAIRLLRRKGAAVAGDLLRLRTAEFVLARRPVPSDAARRARLVAATLNRWGGLSAVPVTPEDLVGTRDAVLRPFVRHRFDAAAAAAASGAPCALEAAIAADSLLAVWDFQGIATALPAWTRTAAGTPFATRVAEVGRRASLRLGRLDEAARGLDDPGEAGCAPALRGDLLDALGRMEEARLAYEAAIRRNGTDAYARQAYGFHLMKAGRVRDGLASWSVADALSGASPLRRHRPQWAGEPLGRRRLMVLFEHGLGDMIQVARFVPRLLAREPHAAVFARLPAPLLGLLARQFPQVRFVDEDTREPDYDLFVPSMQLAAVLEAPDLEPRARYIDLGATAPRRHARPRVGVCWRGHPRQYEVTRSVPLDAFAGLFDEPRVDFVVLLNRLTPDEGARVAEAPNVEVPPICDFLDLAALVASCDLVVSVDTAVVHLAGAGGVPTVLLSRPDACWRWGAAGPRGPWYDTVDVLRHPGDMDWPHLLDVAASRIRACCTATAAA